MSSNLPPTHPSNQLGLSHTVFQKWLRFRSGSSTKLWTTFVVVMIAVAIARAPWLFPGGIEKGQLPGEYYYFRIPLNKALLWTHLASVIPAGLLAATQFIPRVRARAIGFHRNAGKVINVLSFVITLTGWGIGRISFGGDLATQSSVYFLGITTLWSVVKSWTAIRRLQIDEHRIWAIRAWSYHAQVLSERAVGGLLIAYMTFAGGFYYPLPCNQVAYMLGNQELYVSDYPQCQEGWAGRRVTHVSIEANAADPTGMGLSAAVNACFGAAMWIALLIHVVGTEYYIYKTRDESERQRELSMKRQKVRQTTQERRKGD